ncbi:YraN family protein [Actibacterium sp. MT2.3-13A]|uniref:YraN family protein n=1 Tax=Actibacterium sp. MT2.3-13A TaxID=2828332 RepID=UPI001BA95B34|nr:YraN family protein [Actibacterium sp. MT2.3-13A]
MRGTTSYHAGRVAEDTVAERYRRQGLVIAGRRWRGAGGEIDLIARDGDAVIFIEVKKSRSHARAAERLGQRQIARLFSAASEFLAGEPKGQLTEARFDVALVDGMGQVEILENALVA